ncbi:MAG: hypothetical protein F9B45_32255 [Phycisphaera sp. RhM]|nr:hypothetical protein [Phycisphaera sp. RhM]
MMKPTLADTDARQGILDRINTKHVDIPPLPDVDVDRVIQFDEPIDKFVEMLATVGGQAHQVESQGEVRALLEEIEVFRTATRIVSLAPESIAGTIDATQIADPHDLSTVDWTIARGEFMVAENGSIWIDGDTLPHRVLLFIAQYLAIVVPRSQIVSNMHQAYERIENFSARFGVFVSGPSKTADIEQSLVLGAHGCRKLQVFIVGDL